LIVVEGIDGAGKSTLAQKLARALMDQGKSVVQSKEPTAGPWGMQLRASAASGRADPQQEVAWVLQDRRQHVQDVIQPALARRDMVILDRYFPSMIAYQGAAGLDVNHLLNLNDFAPRPDLWLLLDLPITTGLGRICSRGDAPNHFENEKNLQRCRAIFLELNLPNRQVIDASQEAETVFMQAWAAVQELLSRS